MGRNESFHKPLCGAVIGAEKAPMAFGSCAVFHLLNRQRKPNLPDMSLTPLQERFCEEYLKDLNASQAAKRAGSKAENTSPAGSEFLANPNVAARITEMKAARSAETKIDAAWLLTRLAQE